MEVKIGVQNVARELVIDTSLSPDDREVVWLRVCAGLSSDEVGDIVGKKAGTVRMQQLRALEAMARQLTP